MPIFLTVISFGACVGRPDDVWGDDGRVRVTSDVFFRTSIYAEAWNPTIPLALGTTTKMSAIGWKDSSGYMHDYGPNAYPSIVGDALAVLNAETDTLELLAAEPGFCTLSWTGGDAEDTLSVEVAAPSYLQVADPAVVAVRLALSQGGEVLYGELPPEANPFDPIVLAEDSTVGLWFSLRDEESREVAHNDSELSVSVDGGSTVAVSANELVLEASGSDRIDLQYAGQNLSPITVTSVGTDAVAAVSLIVVTPGQLDDPWDFDLVVGAMALDDAGRRIYYPETAWTIPAGFEELTGLEPMLGEAYARTDVRALRWIGGDGPLADVEFSAAIGDLTTSATIRFSPEAAEPRADDIREPEPTTSGCCGTTALGSSALVLVAWGSRRRVRYSGLQTPTSWQTKETTEQAG